MRNYHLLGQRNATDRIGTLAKWATISIDVLLVDTITNAIHSRSRHSVICWALNGFVVNLTAASSPNKMIHCDGRWVPTTSLIIDFSTTNPDTGLALGQTCQSGLWNLGVKTLERKTWSMASGSDYGDICTSYLVSSNLIKQGWIVTGSDACTEDTRDCTVDNVRCFAVRLK